MNTGQYISAGSHFGLIAYVMFGGLFFTPSTNEPVAVQEVSMISEAEFAALTRENTAPDLPDVAPQITAPEQPSAPAPETPAAPAEPTPDTPPVLQSQPSAAPEASLEDPGAGLPDIADQTPTPRPVPRVAPEAVVNPDPTPEIAAEVTPEVSDQAETPAPEPVEEQPAAAPQEAVTEIVTEAETPSGMSTSPRPKARPASIVAAAQRKQEAEEQAKADAEAQRRAEAAEQAATDAANAAADAASALIAEATSSTPAAPDRPTGPPLTGGEREGLRVAVSQCWNTGSMSSEALRTKITVALDMNADGTPQNGSIRLLSSSGGTAASAQQAFQTARRAIIICGKKGFPLPQEKFAQWQSIEMTFDPEQMRFK